MALEQRLNGLSQSIEHIEQQSANAGQPSQSQQAEMLARCLAETSALQQKFAQFGQYSDDSTARDAKFHDLCERCDALQQKFDAQFDQYLDDKTASHAKFHDFCERCDALQQKFA